MMDFKKFVRLKEDSSPRQQQHDFPSKIKNSFVVTKIRACKDLIDDAWENHCERMTIRHQLRGRTRSSLSQVLDKAAGQLLTTVDPLCNFIQRWNKAVLILCVIALAFDPLFFYIPVVRLSDKCMELDAKMARAACVLRTIVDVLYVFHMVLKFRTAFIPPSKEVFGRDDLVTGSYDIAKRYLSTYFFVDIVAILPLPQIVLLWVIPQLYGSKAYVAKESLKFVILSQSVPRIIRIYPIYKLVKSHSGFLTQTAWAGAAFNLFLYMLASHMAGAFWYLISVERQESCWHETCDGIGIQKCDPIYLYCDQDRTVSSDVLQNFIDSMKDSCPLINADDITDRATFDFGIFIDAIRSRVVESKRFRKKLFYCFWWGLRGLSSVGQNLKTSMFTGEIVFAVGISIAGLVLFALLIGNMQTYLQSLSRRVEEMRVKRGDAELWMSQRTLPDAIKSRIRLYQQSKWHLTRGVEEEALITDLPKDLRRDIKRHLCVKSLMKVPLFKKMDQQLKDAMCDRLKPVLYTEHSTIIWEGEPVDEILFIIKGWCTSESKMTNGQVFLRSNVLKNGDICGEELLCWALDPNSTPNQLPTSNRTVVTKSQLEGYALSAHDFKSLASQFWSRLHIKNLEHAFKFHSLEWRIKGASTIQAAWRRHVKRKRKHALRLAEQQRQQQQSVITTTTTTSDESNRADIM